MFKTPSILKYYKIIRYFPSFQRKKALQQNAKGLEMFWLPRQDDYRTFCISDEAKKVYQKLEEIIRIC